MPNLLDFSDEILSHILTQGTDITDVWDGSDRACKTLHRLSTDRLALWERVNKTVDIIKHAEGDASPRTFPSWLNRLSIRSAIANEGKQQCSCCQTQKSADSFMNALSVGFSSTQIAELVLDYSTDAFRGLVPTKPLKNCLATTVPNVGTLLQVIRSEEGQPDIFLTRVRQSDDETKWHYHIGSFAKSASSCYKICHIAGQLLSAGDDTLHKITVVAMSDLTSLGITEASMSDMRALDGCSETEKRMIEIITRRHEEEVFNDRDEGQRIEAVVPHVDFQTEEAFRSTVQGKILNNHLALARARGWQEAVEGYPT